MTYPDITNPTLRKILAYRLWTIRRARWRGIEDEPYMQTAFTLMAEAAKYEAYMSIQAVQRSTLPTIVLNKN